MNKKFLIGMMVVLLAGIGLALYLAREEKPAVLTISQQEIINKYGQLFGRMDSSTSQTQAVLTPIALSRPLRLAIGGLGPADNDESRKLGDLVTVQLSGTPGFELVERQSLSAVLRELNLNWSGFVRAKDAIRAGKLLKADWFLLGTEAEIHGTNSIVARVVDARTGVMLNAGVFAAERPPTELAADLAGFLRQSRQDAASAKQRVYLAVGAFEDLSVNGRLAGLPAQLSAYLTAAYGGSGVTLLERESVETLLREVDLDLAGLTEESWTGSPPAMQSAFWVVSGQYQSYETTNLQVELNLDVQRVFGNSSRQTLRALPGDPLGRQTKAAIDEVMRQNSGAIFATRRTEARIQMQLGRELLGNPIDPRSIPGTATWDGDPLLAAKEKRNLEEAMRAFETVLLLDRTNREAKMYLAGCLQKPVIYRLAESREFYRQVIDESESDRWTEPAQQRLESTFDWSDPSEVARWYAVALGQSTNPAAAAFYRTNGGLAARDVAIKGGEKGSVELAQQRLLDRIRSCKQFCENQSSPFYGDYGLFEFRSAFPDEAAGAQAMADFLPTMEKTFPEFGPHLAGEVLWFQVDTNSPVVAEFEKNLDWCIAHPTELFAPADFWSSSAVSAREWLAGRRRYAMVIKVLEATRVAASQNRAVRFGDPERLELGYAYLGAERWRDALVVFESFSNRVVTPTSDGIWGRAFEPLFPEKLREFCGQKLGLTVKRDARIFDMGEPAFCLCTPSTFAADENGLWVGVSGQLLHLDFDLKTNLVVALPMDASVPITALCLGPSTVWIGTGGGGLIEFDKANGKCRRFTEADGLMMNYLASLAVDGDSLWIGYGSATGGGLGQFDVRSQKIISYMPSLLPGSVVRESEAPPHSAVQKIMTGTDGDLWFLESATLRRFHLKRSTWETLENQAGERTTSFIVDSEHLVAAGNINLVEIGIQDTAIRHGLTNDRHRTNMIVTVAECNRLEQELRTNGSNRYICSVSGGEQSPNGALAIQNLRNHRWQHLEDSDGFPNPPTTLTLDGDNLWVGGEGVIALVDLKAGKVRKFSHIKAETVERIEIAGGYLWAQFDWHLYRAPLSAVQ